MLRTSLGRYVLCAGPASPASLAGCAARSRSLLPSELLSPTRRLGLSRGLGLGPTFSSFANHTTRTSIGQQQHQQRRFQSSSASALAAKAKPSPSKTENFSSNEKPEAPGEPNPLPLFTSLQSSIHPSTLKALTVSPFKFTHMSPVQAEILPMLPGLASPGDNEAGGAKDLLVRAKTGTGKTIAFLVPAIERRAQAIKAHLSSLPSSTSNQKPSDLLRAETSFARSSVGALIISPTRELASQIAVESQNLTAHHRGWNVQLLLGGESRVRQMRAWEGGRKDIVVATPGRILDLLNSEESVREAVGRCELLVLDEADTLLDMGFRDDITRLLTYLPPQPIRQTFLFSATVSPAIQQIARASLSPTNHLFVNCVGAGESEVHAHIPQHVHVLREGREMMYRLMGLLAADMLGNKKSRIVIFLSTTNGVSLFSAFLRKALLSPPRGAPSSSSSGAPGTRHTPKHILPLPPSQISLFEIHSKRDQSQRSRTSAAFRSSHTPCSILVTSDVSARGVDYPGITRVIQIGVPSSRETYIHRVGRTGRAGRTDGRGDLLVMDWEEGFVRRRLGGVGVRHVGEGEVEREVERLGEEVVERVVMVEERVGGSARRAGRGRRDAPVLDSTPTPTTTGPPEARFGRTAREEMRTSTDQLISSFSSSSSSSPSSPSHTSPSSSFSSYPPRTETQDLIHSAFASLAGFIAGRSGAEQGGIGLDVRQALAGLKRSWREMWDLDREPALPRGLEGAGGGGGRGGGGGYGRGGGGGGYGGGRGGGGYGGGRDGGWGGRGRVASRQTYSNNNNNGSSYDRRGSFNSYNNNNNNNNSNGYANSNAYGYEKGSRPGSKYSRVGKFERQRTGFSSGGEREAAWGEDANGYGYGGRGRKAGGWGRGY